MVQVLNSHMWTTGIEYFSSSQKVLLDNASQKHIEENGSSPSVLIKLLPQSANYH